GGRWVGPAGRSGAGFGLAGGGEGRLTEPWNRFEGTTVGVGDGALRRPANWRHLRNPFRPSWGEPYVDIAARMRLPMADAVRTARGHEAVLVSHQLPIWVARREAEDRRLWHHPGRRQCALASVTSSPYRGDPIDGTGYAEPAGAGRPQVPGA